MTIARRFWFLGFALVPLLALALASCADDGGPDLDTNYPSAGEDRLADGRIA